MFVVRASVPRAHTDPVHFWTVDFHLGTGFFTVSRSYPFHSHSLFVSFGAVHFFLGLLLFSGNTKRWTLKRTLFFHHHLDCSFLSFFCVTTRTCSNRRKVSTHKVKTKQRTKKIFTNGKSGVRNIHAMKIRAIPVQKQLSSQHIFIGNDFRLKHFRQVLEYYRRDEALNHNRIKQIQDSGKYQKLN